MLLLGLVVAYYVLVPVQNCFYKSANDPGANNAEASEHLSVSGRLRFLLRKPPELLLQNGSIYLPLRHRKAWPSLLAVGAAKEENWTIEKLQRFATNHSELKNL